MVDSNLNLAPGSRLGEDLGVRSDIDIPLCFVLMFLLCVQYLKLLRQLLDYYFGR